MFLVQTISNLRLVYKIAVEQLASNPFEVMLDVVSPLWNVCC